MVKHRQTAVHHSGQTADLWTDSRLCALMETDQQCFIETADTVTHWTHPPTAAATLAPSLNSPTGTYRQTDNKLLPTSHAKSLCRTWQHLTQSPCVGHGDTLTDIQRIPWAAVTGLSYKQCLVKDVIPVS